METQEFLIFGREIQKTNKETIPVVSISRTSGKFSFSKAALELMGNPEKVFFVKKGNTWFVMATDAEEAIKMGGKEGSPRKGFTAISFIHVLVPKEHKDMLTVEYPLVLASETYNQSPLFKILLGNGREIGLKRRPRQQ